jgi:hypothetical protein
VRVSPDGTRLTFAAGFDGGGVWVLEIFRARGR